MSQWWAFAFLNAFSFEELQYVVIAAIVKFTYTGQQCFSVSFCFYQFRTHTIIYFLKMQFRIHFIVYILKMQSFTLVET